MILVDTCILIDYSKGYIEIEEGDFSEYYINSIVQLEFLLILQKNKNQIYIML